jgi:hypothetical protein
VYYRGGDHEKSDEPFWPQRHLLLMRADGWSRPASRGLTSCEKGDDFV